MYDWNYKVGNLFRSIFIQEIVYDLLNTIFVIREYLIEQFSALAYDFPI